MLNERNNDILKKDCLTILRKSGGKKVSIYIQNFKKFRPLLGELIARDNKKQIQKISVRSIMDIVKSTVYDDYFV